MDPNAIAGMAFTLVLIGMIGGFIMLFPVARRLGLLLEGKIQERKEPTRGVGVETRQLMEHVDALAAQVQRLAERQDFTEQLLKQREPTALPVGRNIER